MWSYDFRRRVLNLSLGPAATLPLTVLRYHIRTVLSTDVLVKNSPSLLSQIDVTAPVCPAWCACVFCLLSKLTSIRRKYELRRDVHHVDLANGSLVAGDENVLVIVRRDENQPRRLPLL